MESVGYGKDVDSLRHIVQLQQQTNQEIADFNGKLEDFTHAKVSHAYCTVRVLSWSMAQLAVSVCQGLWCCSSPQCRYHHAKYCHWHSYEDSWSLDKHFCRWRVWTSMNLYDCMTLIHCQSCWYSSPEYRYLSVWPVVHEKSVLINKWQQMLNCDAYHNWSTASHFNSYCSVQIECRTGWCHVDTTALYWRIGRHHLNILILRGYDSPK